MSLVKKYKETPNTLEVILSSLKYAEADGLLYWKTRPLSHFKNTRMRLASVNMSTWNTKNSGNAVGTLHHTGYILVGIAHKYFERTICYAGHRLAWAVHYEQWPNDELDHVDGNRANNRIANLRIVDRTTNFKNKAMYKNVSSHTQVTGVRKVGEKYIVRIGRGGGKYQHIGTFDSLLAAISARKEAEIEYGYHENHGRVHFT